MPDLAARGFSPEQVQELMHVSINFNMKNDPIDQIKTDRPWLKDLLAKAKNFGGTLQYITESVRLNYGSNGTFIGSGEEVTFNSRTSVVRAEYEWVSYHDGFVIDEERLERNGIIVSESASGVMDTATKGSVIQLNNLMTEQMTILKEGAQEKMSMYLHADGSINSKNIVGLDALVSSVPTVGVVGGISRATTPAWRNYASALAQGNILEGMEEALRACKRTSSVPTCIYMGYDFYKAVMAEVKDASDRRINFNAGDKGTKVDYGLDMMTFHGIPVKICYEWDDDFGGLLEGADWSKRCYFIDHNAITLRPLVGNDFVTRKPMRQHNRFSWYISLLWKGALTMNKANSHAVLWIV